MLPRTTAPRTYFVHRWSTPWRPSPGDGHRIIRLPAARFRRVADTLAGVAGSRAVRACRTGAVQATTGSCSATRHRKTRRRMARRPFRRRPERARLRRAIPRSSHPCWGRPHQNTAYSAARIASTATAPTRVLARRLRSLAPTLAPRQTNSQPRGWRMKVRKTALWESGTSSSRFPSLRRTSLGA